MPVDMFHQKSHDLRRNHEKKIKMEQILLSDECPEIDDEISKETSDLFNSRVLGFQKDYIDEAEDITHSKEKPGNSQSGNETPSVIVPMDFTKVKINDVMLKDREHYFMD